MYRRDDPRRFSSKYIPSTWFKRELKKISPRLRTSWNDLEKCWEISERVPGFVPFTDNQWDIAGEMRPVYEKVLYSPVLNSCTLNWIQRNRIDRYKTIADLDLDTVVKKYA